MLKQIFIFDFPTFAAILVHVHQTVLMIPVPCCKRFLLTQNPQSRRAARKWEQSCSWHSPPRSCQSSSASPRQTLEEKINENITLLQVKIEGNHWTHLQQELEDHGSVDILLGDGGQPKVGPTNRIPVLISCSSNNQITWKIISVRAVLRNRI